MQNYRKGADFERKIVNAYRKMGFFAARTAGSHSPVDVVVVTDTTILLIQCKKGKLSKKAKETAMKQMPVQFPREFMVSSILWSDDGSEVVLNGNIKFKGSKK